MSLCAAFLAPALCARTLPAAAPVVPLARVGPGPAPVVDGRLTDPGWGACAQFFPFAEAGGAGLAQVQTRALVFYDDANLYIAFRCEEPEPAKLVAQYGDRDTGVWRDDCIEIFLERPGATGPDHFIVNSRGTFYDARAGDAQWNAKAKIAVRVEDTAWTVECALPWTDLGGPPRAGDVWRANFCRERKVHNELSNWSCTYGNFGRPERFGRLVFADAAVRLEELSLAPPTPGANSATVYLRLPPGPAATLYAQGMRAADIAPGGRPVRLLYPLGLGDREIRFEARRGAETLWRCVLPFELTPKPALAELERVLTAVGAAAARLPRESSARQSLLAVASPANQAAAALRGAIEESLKTGNPLDKNSYSRLNGAVARAARELDGKLWPIWRKNCWQDVDRGEPPLSVEDLDSEDFLLLVNEYQSANVIVSNLGTAPLRLRVEAGDLVRRLPIDGNRKNLIRNAGFEQDRDRDGVPDAWLPATGNRKCWRSVAVPGHGRVLLVDRNELHDAFTLRQRVTVTPGKMYTLEFETRTRNAGNDVRVILINKGWYAAPGTPFIRGTRDWRRVRVVLRAPNKPPHQIVIWGQGGGSGKVWIDNLRLVEGAGFTQTVPDSAPRLAVADWQELRGGGRRADPLIPLNPAGRLDVPPGENRQIWLTFRAANLPPGEYDSSLVLRPLATADSPTPAGKRVDLRLEVAPLRLSTSPEFAVYNWDYARDEAQVRDLFEHKVNVFLMSTALPLPPFAPDGTPQADMDFAEYDRMLRIKLRYARRAHGELLFSYGIVRDFQSTVSKRYGWKFMDPAWIKAFSYAYSAWLRHLRELGLKTDEFSVQVWDEATGANAANVVRVGPLLRRLDPDVRLTMDGAQSLAEVTAMAPYIDLWIPHLPHLLNGKDHAELLAWYRASGKPVWTYTCRTRMKAQSPYEYHRLKPWQAAALRLDGVCYWAYNSWRGDPWNDFDGPIADCGVIYPGVDRPISSRRWEATREGVEDWQLLRLLKRLAGRADATDGQTAAARIETAVRSVLAAPNEPDRAENERRKLIRLAQDLATRQPLVVSGLTVQASPRSLQIRCSTNRPTSGVVWSRSRTVPKWTATALTRGTTHVVDIPQTGPAKPRWTLVLWDDAGRVRAADPTPPRSAD
ncbi:MAG: DUF4091 domain-containing protein [Kiritimatiellaeota bacterium]|nr:DUF4091 domain-containing protein [Kiritimatiellota bacterium]